MVAGSRTMIVLGYKGETCWEVLGLAYDITMAAMRVFIVLAIPFWVIILLILTNLSDV